MWQIAALIGAGLALFKNNSFAAEAPTLPVQPWSARFSKKEGMDDWAMRQKGYQSIRYQNNYDAEGINSKLCVLCKKHYGKYGHNAQPLADGRCCDACNDKVVAARMAMMFGAETMNKRKVIGIKGSDPRLRTLQKDKDISPEEARDRLEISAENSEAKCDFCDGWYCGNENWCMICATGLDCCRCDTPYPSLAAEFGAETFNAAVLHKKPKGYVGKAVAMDALMTQARIEEAMLQLETAVKLGLISEDEIMEQIQRQFGSEEYAGNYMVPADIKSLARSVKVLQSKARADQNQPEWWKSKLSVVAAELDDLTDFFDYAEDTGML